MRVWGFGFWGLRVRRLGFGGLEIKFCGLGFVLAIWRLDLCLWFGCLLWLRVGINTWSLGFLMHGLGFGFGVWDRVWV